MPEVQLSPRRIREHLRKRWYIYLVGAVLLCFLNNLIYTVTRPRLPERALLRVMLVNVDAAEAELDALAEALLPAAQAADAELRKIEFEALQYLGESDAPSNIQLTTRFVAGGADFFIADAMSCEVMAARGYCAALDGTALQNAQANPAALDGTSLQNAQADPAARPGAESDTPAPLQGMELVPDPETGLPCAVGLDAGAIFQDAAGEIYLFVSAGADNPAAAHAVLQYLATGVN